MNEQEFDELAAGHALNALSDADERRYADALAEHPEWQRTVDLDAQTAALLSEYATPVMPSPDIRSSLLAQIATAPQQPVDDTAPQQPVDDTVPQQPVDDATPRRRGRLLFALAASVALIVGIGVGVTALNAYLTRPASVVALEKIESSTDAQEASVELESGATATAHWSASVGEAVLVAEGLDALEDDSTYQLWFVRGEEALPAGVFDADAGTATAVLDGTMHEGDVIAVTVEQAGGSPTGLPTSDPIIVIPTA